MKTFNLARFKSYAFMLLAVVMTCSLTGCLEDDKYRTEYEPYYFIDGASSLNVRYGPGKSYDVVWQLHEKDVVTVVENSDDGEWTFIKRGAFDGWVSAKYVKKGMREKYIPIEQNSIVFDLDQQPVTSAVFVGVENLQQLTKDSDVQTAAIISIVLSIIIALLLYFVPQWHLIAFLLMIPLTVFEFIVFITNGVLTPLSYDSFIANLFMGIGLFLLPIVHFFNVRALAGISMNDVMTDADKFFQVHGLISVVFLVPAAICYFFNHAWMDYAMFAIIFVQVVSLVYVLYKSFNKGDLLGGLEYIFTMLVFGTMLVVVGVSVGFFVFCLFLAIMVFLSIFTDAGSGSSRGISSSQRISLRDEEGHEVDEIDSSGRSTRNGNQYHKDFDGKWKRS